MLGVSPSMEEVRRGSVAEDAIWDRLRPLSMTEHEQEFPVTRSLARQAGSGISRAGFATYVRVALRSPGAGTAPTSQHARYGIVDRSGIPYA